MQIQTITTFILFYIIIHILTANTNHVNAKFTSVNKILFASTNYINAIFTNINNILFARTIYVNAMLE